MYDYGVVGVMYASCQLALLASVRYWLYRDRLRVPAKVMYLVLTAISLAGGGAWLLTGGVPGMHYDSYRILLAVFMFALSCCVIRAPFAEHAFSYAFILAYDAAVETTAFYLQTNFFLDNAAYAYPLIAALLMAVSLYPAARALKNMIARIAAMDAVKVWGWLDLACFSFLLMNLFGTLPRPARLGLYYPICRFLMLLGMAGVYKTAVRVMDTARAAADAQAGLALASRRVAMQQSYYDRMLSQMEEVRRMRHDLRHHRAALSALIKAGDTAALSEYLNAAMPAEDVVPATGNLTADSVLTYYLDMARALSVQVETNVAIGRETPVSDPELCVLLGNLLENAVEAQKYVPPERRFIRVAAKADARSLTLAVDNRFDGALRQENGAYASRKAGEGHGLGLASVRAVCEHCGGVLQIDTDGDMFLAGVFVAKDAAPSADG